MDTVLELAAVTGVRAACDALGVARSSLYRLRPIMGPVELAMSRPDAVKKTKTPPARSLSATLPTPFTFSSAMLRRLRSSFPLGPLAA